jgi:hypothetical protein
MIDLIDNRTLLIVGCTALVLAGLIGVLTAMFLARQEEARRRQLVAVSEVTRDWQPTWKINLPGRPLSHRRLISCRRLINRGLCWRGSVGNGESTDDRRTKPAP